MTGYTRILAVLLAVLIGGGVGLLARLVLSPSEAPIVTVLREGFEFEGRKYQSLSAIARAITGTRWNGWRFFGLREITREGR